jgi:hypothetical protein
VTKRLLCEAAMRAGSHEIDRLVEITRAAFNVSAATGWRFLGDEWTRFEITQPLRELIETGLIYCPRWVARRGFMTTKEREAYRALPEMVTVYRGGRGLQVISGLSWTTSKKSARFFADYAGGARRSLFGMKASGRPVVYTTTVRKTDVLGVKNSRGEHEVVLIPRAVRLTATTTEWL